MIFGIIQGRLTKPIEGHQTTPKNWEREFDLCKKLNIDYIEWNIDFNKDRNNPLFFDPKISNYSKMISSVCFDTLVCNDSFDEEYFRNQTYDHTEKIRKLGIRKVTFPFLESSQIRTAGDIKSIVKILRNYNKKFPNMQINLELDCKVETIDSILSEINFCFLTYDTGNLTHNNIDHELYIDKFFSKINNVHLKDRSLLTGESFHDFKGDTPFLEIFKNLSLRNYNNIFTLQMARKNDMDEVELNKNYISKFRRMYEEQNI